jgi:hypothetical protein
MFNLHLSPHTIQVTKSFEGGLMTIVAVISAITAATLIYAWFLT